MSRLFWMSQVIATTQSEYISYTPSNSAYYPSSVSQVKAALDSLASQKTGIRMQQSLAAGTTSVSFNNSLFTDSMYVDYYANKEFELDGFPTYASNTITLKYKPLKAACTLKIVAKL